MKRDYYRIHGERVRGIMRSQDLRHWWVAECSGVHKTTLRRWLSGQIAQVRANHVEKLASTLQIDRATIAERLAPLSRAAE